MKSNKDGFRVTYEFKDGTVVKREDFKGLSSAQKKIVAGAFKTVFCKG